MSFQSVQQTVQQAVQDNAPIGHTVSTGLILASFTGWLTPIATLLATLLAIVWYSITIYETQTFKDLFARLKARRKNRVVQPPDMRDEA